MLLDVSFTLDDLLPLIVPLSLSLLLVIGHIPRFFISFPLLADLQAVREGELR